MNNPYLNLLQAVWQYGKPWRLTIVAYYIAFVLAQIFLSLSPYAFGRTIDILQHFSPARLSELIFWLSVGIAVLLLFWLFHGPGRVIERQVALKIQQAFRIKLYEQLTQLPLKWHQDHHSGDTITRIGRASNALYRFAGDEFVYVELIVKFLMSIGFLLWISWVVGILSLTACLLAITTVILFDRVLIPLYNAQNEIDNQVGATIFDYISNMTTILTLRLGDLTKHHLLRRLLSVWPFFRKDTVINEVKWFSMGLVVNSLQSIILIAYIISNLHATTGIMIGTVVMIFRYQWDLGEIFYNLSANYSELVRMNTDLKGINPLLQDIERLAHPIPNETLARQWHTLTVNDLSFHHAGSDERQNSLKHLNFTIHRGEKIALIGSSGAGKSTLLNVLRGLYKPEEVSLMIDDTSFHTLEPLRAITTLIPQDPEIFENTIAFNITLEVESSQEEIDQAIKIACFRSVLNDLPKGLQTDIREKGLNLSVGQKQRLALARGLFAARYSSLILLDEPTSSVDLPTEKEILNGIMAAFPDAAIIVSLHRLHLLPKFDRVLMLSEGKIVAMGETQQLLNKAGPVRELWQAYQE